MNKCLKQHTQLLIFDSLEIFIFDRLVLDPYFSQWSPEKKLYSESTWSELTVPIQGLCI